MGQQHWQVIQVIQVIQVVAAVVIALALLYVVARGFDAAMVVVGRVLDHLVPPRP